MLRWKSSLKPAAAAAWSPLDEASLDSYWDPTDESSITGSPAVTTLEDLGPNGNDLSANGTPQTGVRTINSLNVIDFDGVNEYLSNSTYTLNSTVTFVGVFLVDVNGSNVNESILSVDATVDFQIDSGDGGSDWDGRLNPTGTGSVTSWSDSNSKNGVEMIVSVTFDAVANTIDVWYDGYNMVSLSNYTTDLDGTQDLKIMGNRNGSYTANGAFGGMAIFNSANTDIRQNAEGFFAERFALTGNLVSGHPYSTAATYVLEENFEGTGTPSGWSVTSGSVDFDATPPSSSPNGGEVLKFTNRNNVVEYSISTSRALYLYFQFYVDSTGFSATEIVKLETGATGRAAALYLTADSTDNLLLRSGYNAEDAPVNDYSVDTWYHCWIYYNPATGEQNLEFNTTGIRSGSGDGYVSRTISTTTNTINKLRIEGRRNANTYIDRVLISESIIGNNP